MTDLAKININFDSSLTKNLNPTTLAELSIELGNEYGELALQAFQSKVPVRTQELRNYIKRSLSSSSHGAEVSIYLPEVTHFSTIYPFIGGVRQKSKPTLDEVAQDLDSTDFRRSKSAISDVARFTPSSAGDTTKDWQNNAWNDFLGAI
jgi:hypothetical protein